MNLLQEKHSFSGGEAVLLGKHAFPPPCCCDAGATRADGEQMSIAEMLEHWGEPCEDAAQARKKGG